MFFCKNTERQVVGNNRDVSWFVRMANDLKFVGDLILRISHKHLSYIIKEQTSSW